MLCKICDTLPPRMFVKKSLTPRIFVQNPQTQINNQPLPPPTVGVFEPSLKFLCVKIGNSLAPAYVLVSSLTGIGESLPCYWFQRSGRVFKWICDLM